MRYGGLVVVSLFVISGFSPRLIAEDTGAREAKAPRYRLIEIGTFGGPASLVFGGTGDLNQKRTLVTSAADTALFDSNWPNINPWFASGGYLSLYIQHAFEWKQGVLEDLGVLSGGSSSGGFGINSHGAVVGMSTNGTFDPLTGFPEIEPVLWQYGKIVRLGTLGGNGGYAAFINDHGQIAGDALNAIPDPFASALFPGATQVHAFLWEHGAMQDLGTLGGPDSMGFYINERGDITGVSFTNYAPNETTGLPTLDPFLWHDGHMLDLGSLGGTIGTAEAFNNHGQVVGDSNLAGDEKFHPYLWDRGVMTDLGTFGGSNGDAIWINEAGTVVGYANFPGDNRWDAFLWKNGVMTDLGNLGCASKAFSVNSRDQVVGASRQYCNLRPHAVLWENGKLYDLNNLIPPGSGLELVETHQINDEGVIDGNALPAGCDDVRVCGHAFLLIPCDKDDGAPCENDLLGPTANVVAPAAGTSHEDHVELPFERGRRLDARHLRRIPK